MKVTEKLRYLEDRWDESVASKLDPAELLRYRSNLAGLRSAHHQFWRREHEFEDRRDRSDGSFEQERALDQGQRRRHRQHSAQRIRDALLDKLHSLTGRYRGVHSKTRWWRCIRSVRSGTTALQLRSTLPSMDFCRSNISIICIPTGASRWLLPRTARRRWKSSTVRMGTSWSGCRGSGPGSSWR